MHCGQRGSQRGSKVSKERLSEARQGHEFLASAQNSDDRDADAQGLLASKRSHDLASMAIWDLGCMPFASARTSRYQGTAVCRLLTSRTRLFDVSIRSHRRQHERDLRPAYVTCRYRMRLCRCRAISGLVPVPPYHQAIKRGGDLLWHLGASRK